MRRRGYGEAETPPELLRFRPAEWPGGGVRAWVQARRVWRQEHPPRSLAELNLFYPEGMSLPGFDPRGAA